MAEEFNKSKQTSFSWGGIPHIGTPFCAMWMAI
jgi:hypothetical protein